MKSKIMTVILIVSLTINAGIASAILFRHSIAKKMFCRKPAPAIFRSPVHPFPLYKKLGLTKEQEKEIVKFLEEERKAILPLTKKIHEQRKELFRMIKEGRIDQQKKQKIIQEISGLQAQIENIVVDCIVKTRSVMTSEQIEKLKGIFNKTEEEFFMVPPEDTVPPRLRPPWMGRHWK